MNTNQIELINEVLPQTQCTRCGFPSCKDYAVAISEGQADINQCPPGGDEGIKKLSELLHKPIKPLNPINGTIAPKTLVEIDEDICIGCALCIKACPVDAIIGANKMIHTVIADECTGCDLCIPACPVDCINIITDSNSDWTKARANHALMRYESRLDRQQKLKQTQIDLLQKKSAG